MAGPGSVQIPPDSSGKLVDMVSLSVGGVNVVRQVFALGGATDTGSSAYAEMAAASASTGAVGVVVRPTTATVALVAGSTIGINSIGTVTVDGTLNISAMPTVTVTGSVGINSISALPAVAISGTATVAGIVGLTAGAANIGFINHVSRTVQVQVATPFTLQGISTTVQVAVSTPYTINNISATVAVVGAVSLAAGTANIGTLNNISATVNTATRLVTGGAYDNTAGDALKVLIVGGGTGGGTVTLSSGATVRGVFDSSAGSTTLVRVGDSANSAIRVNVVAGGTGGGNVTIGAVSAGVTFPITGAVSLAAGTANIGTLNDISRTVQVAVGTPFTLQGISTTVNVAVATPFTLQGISTTVTVAGVVSLGAGASVGALITGVSNGVAINISTMPAITGSIGIHSISAGVSIAINAISAGVTIGINSISATVNTNLVAVSAGVAINTQARAPAIMSASRGPKCVTASTSANVTLIATPGAGANIYIKQLGVHNFSPTFIAMRVGTSASIQTIVVAAQSSGGGAVYNFDPPWMLSASEAALCSVKPNANYGVFNVQYYVI